MKKPSWIKITLASLLATLAVASLVILPALAVIGGTEINISSLGAGSPDIEISSDGQRIAVAYHKQTSGEGAVYLKSSSTSDGWVTSKFLGNGSNPQLAFRNNPPGPPYVVYVVWRKSGGTAIQSARCTLNATALPTCIAGTDVQTASTDQLNFPDIIRDSSGFLHVAWQNSTNPTTTIIQTARSNAPDSVEGWSAAAPAASSGHNQKPVLAWSNPGTGGKVHLAYLSGTSTTAPDSIIYRRSGDGSDSWSAPLGNFKINVNIINNYDKLDNPTIVASSSNIYLAWDALENSGNNYFSLIYATSTDGTSWTGPAYSTSGTLTNVGDSELKSSQTTPLPPQEVGLRPSVVISNTNPAIVWQQIPGNGCVDANPFSIFLASPLVGGSDKLSNVGNNDSMIDPDLAVASGVRHFVYMRDIDSGCPGGPASDYLITYRGPFTIITHDEGEEGSGGIFLPLILK